jgi:NADH-quinone oxidoreductase subunit N
MKAIIASSLIGVILMFTGIIVKPKNTVLAIATLLIALLLGINIWEVYDLHTGAIAENTAYFNGMMQVDGFSAWFNLLMTGCTLLYVLLTGKEIAKVGNHVADYFALIVFILCGVYLLAGFHNLLMLFIGIEILSIPQYILAGSDKRNLKSSEASLKYFLMGAFTTGIMLMGITLLYGATGSFDISAYASLVSDGLSPLALAGILLMIVALGFKVSAAPMHMWTPDVYDGAPTPFTAYMSTIVKAGAFMAFLRLFHNSYGLLSAHWVTIISIITALTLLIGNLTAVFQQSVKRMLAYSSIAQAGFMLFTILAVNNTANQGLLIYGVAYSVATIGVFTVLMKMKDYTYDGFNGLAKTEPALAFFTAICLFSLAGIPLTGGFMAKYFVLRAVVQQGDLLWLVIFALMMAAVSAWYYFRLIIAMYFKQGNPELTGTVTSYEKFLLGCTCVIILVVGIVPQLILNT